MAYSIEFKVSMYISGSLLNLVNFGGYPMNRFFYKSNKKNLYKNAKRKTTNQHVEKWLMNTLHINTIKCKKFATIVLGQKSNNPSSDRNIKNKCLKIRTIYGV